MSVTARFTYRIQPGGMEAFVAKLKAAGDAKFNSAVMPVAIRFYRSALPGPDADIVILDIDYDSLAAFGARTDFEQSHPDWASIWGPQADAPEELLDLQVIKSFHPFA